MQNQESFNTTPTPRTPEDSISSRILNMLESDGGRTVVLDPLAKSGEIPRHEGGRLCEFLMEQLNDLRSNDETQIPSLDAYMDLIKVALHEDSRLKNIDHLDYKFGLLVTRLQEKVA